MVAAFAMTSAPGVAGEIEPGLNVMVTVNGTNVINYGYGFTQQSKQWARQLNCHTMHDLASVSKQFTGLAIHQLIDQQLLGLHDPITNYMTEFDTIPAMESITVFHLLHHLSGIFDFANDPMLPQLLADAKPIKPTPHDAQPELFPLPPIVTNDDIIAALVASYHADSAKFFSFSPPGSKFEYDNSGYVILAMIVERVSGMPFGHYLDKNIFEPMDMTRTMLQGNMPMRLDFLHNGGRDLDIARGYVYNATTKGIRITRNSDGRTIWPGDGVQHAGRHEKVQRRISSAQLQAAVGRRVGAISRIRPSRCFWSLCIWPGR